MKLSKLKIGILSGVTLAIVGGGVATYALLGHETSQASQTTAPPMSTVTEPVTQPVTEPVAEPVSQPVAQPAPEPTQPASQPVAVRSFEEIVKDYPNMSTGLPGFPECAGYLKNAWPEKFTNENREENIKWVSQTFVNVCAAINGKTTRAEMYTLQYYWGR